VGLLDDKLPYYKYILHPIVRYLCKPRQELQGRCAELTAVFFIHCAAQSLAVRPTIQHSACQAHHQHSNLLHDVARSY
jgi:hypothetical protein